MKILITGSSGFLGSHLSAFLKNSEHEITLLNSKNCDLRNSNNLITYSDEKFDFLFKLSNLTETLNSREIELADLKSKQCQRDEVIFSRLEKLREENSILKLIKKQAEFIMSKIS